TWSFVLPPEETSGYVNPSAPPLEEANQSSWRDTTPSDQRPLPRLYPDLESPRYSPEPLVYSNQSIRAGFVRKVFGLVAIMVMIVTIECALAMT
ncbi:hypothetical protein PMAYCL1PPCAC_28144, partial [Pristionchus mayeri]